MTENEKTELLKTVYDSLRTEYRKLKIHGQYGHGTNKLRGYRDAVWDLSVILYEEFNVEVERLKTEEI